MVEYIKGDLLDTDCKYIAHGVNCQGVMGSGVAKVLREKYPKIYDDYSKAIEAKDFNWKYVIGSVNASQQLDGVTVLNCFTQPTYGYSNKRYVDYEAIYQCFNIISTQFVIDELAMPKIGAGLGGGDWNIIEAMIKSTLCKVGIKVKVYEL